MDDQRPVTVGFWFSLGHSSVVFVMVMGIALGVRALAAGVDSNASSLQRITSVWGTSISGAFLLLIGIINLVALVGITGLAIGSFLNVCIVRWPRERSVLRPRSRCPQCANQLAWFERYVTDWTGPTGRVGRLSFRMIDSIFPGDTMVFTAVVSSVDTDDQGCGWAGVDITVKVGDKVCTTCKGRVGIPTSPDDNPWTRRGESWKP